MTAGNSGTAGDSPAAVKGSCSPCCSKAKKKGTAGGDKAPTVPEKPLYKSDTLRPVKGNVPASKAGFLVSFLVDARGGAMTGHRHWGMRIVIPPGAVTQPTRINCKYQPLSALAFPPPFMEREALASRVIETSPALQSFRSPVLLEIPHFASTAGAQREIVILRSNDGETWVEHVSDMVDDGQIYQDVVTSVVCTEEHGDLERVYDVLEVKRGRVVRVLTSSFPKYFAIVTRVREEVKSMGGEGGKVTLPQEPRCRATFPKNALHKRIKVGLQAQTLTPEIVQAAFGRSVEVSQIVAVEPRKRKFHQPIFVSIPLPCQPSKLTPATSLRLLCSVTGSADKAEWEDMTGSTPLELNKDVVHFSTKVSALYWILVIHDKQRDPESALTLASRLYEEAALVPYLARISVFYRENYPRAWVNTIRIYCMTDDKAEKVIQSLQGFRPLAISGEVEIPTTAPIAVKIGGNILQLLQDPFTGEMMPVSTIRTQFLKEKFTFRSFEENVLTLLVQPKENGKPLAGSFTFYRKLTHISANQNLYLCQLDFNVDKEMSGHNIKEDFLFHQPEENIKKIVVDDYEEVKKPAKYDEEDLYEKIEVKGTLPKDFSFYKKPVEPSSNNTMSKEHQRNEIKPEKEVKPKPVVEEPKGNLPKNFSFYKKPVEPLVNNETFQAPKSSKSEGKGKDKNLKLDIEAASARGKPPKEEIPFFKRSTNSLNNLFKKKEKKKKLAKFDHDDLVQKRKEYAEKQGVKNVVVPVEEKPVLPPVSPVKAKSFKPNDLKRLRSQNAEGQGVKNVVRISTEDLTKVAGCSENEDQKYKFDSKKEENNKSADILANREDKAINTSSIVTIDDKNPSKKGEDSGLTENQKKIKRKAKEKCCKSVSSDSKISEPVCDLQFSEEHCEMVQNNSEVLESKDDGMKNGDQQIVEGNDHGLTEKQKQLKKLAKEKKQKSEFENENENSLVLNNESEKVRNTEGLNDNNQLSENKQPNNSVDIATEIPDTNITLVEHDETKNCDILPPTTDQQTTLNDNKSINSADSPSFHRNDDIIGYDLGNLIVEKPKAEDEKMPEQAKAKNLVSSSDAQCKSECTTQKKKEARVSFIKEWQQDLKDFFGIGKQKKEKKEITSVENENSAQNAETKSDNASVPQRPPIRYKKNSKENLPKSLKNESEVTTEKPNIDPANIETIKDAKDIGNNSDGVDKTSLDNQGKTENFVDTEKKSKKRSRSNRRKTNSGEYDGDYKVDNVLESNVTESVVSCSMTQKTESAQTVTNTKVKTKRKKRPTRSESEDSVGRPDASPETGESMREKSILAAGGKPKVVVPSPRGIPRPKPLSVIKSENRLSMASTDSWTDDDLVEVDMRIKSRSIEDSEEFKKAVDTFEEIFQSENRLEDEGFETGHIQVTTTSVEIKETCKRVDESHSSPIIEKKSSTVVTSFPLQRSEETKIISEVDTSSMPLDPECVKNVDGTPRQRKGSSRFLKRQTSKSNRSSNGSIEEELEKERKLNSDLTSRLEATSQQMLRLDQTFQSLCQTVPDTDNAESVVGHSTLSRTRIQRSEGPLDEVIEAMIMQPDNGAKEIVIKSVENSPIFYRAEVRCHSKFIEEEEGEKD